MRILFTVAFLLVFLAGCAPTAQPRRASETKGVRLYPVGMDGGRLVFFVELAAGKLLHEKSYAVSPRGKHYPLMLEQQIEKGPSIVSLLFDGEDVRNEASNGFWMFHVTFERGGWKQTVRIQRRLTIYGYGQPVGVKNFWSGGGRTEIPKKPVEKPTE